tara:strand:- start:1399 stop:1608 length:210 start_codon:yes stop_codon:yes gene_type:complete
MTTRKKQLAIRVGQDELKTVEAAAAQWPNQTTGQIGVPLARFIREAVIAQADLTLASPCSACGSTPVNH